MVEVIGDDRSDTLPDGTDTVIQGAASSGETGTVTVEETSDVVDREIIGAGNAGVSTTGGRGSSQGLADRFRNGREELTTQAGERARARGQLERRRRRVGDRHARVRRLLDRRLPQEPSEEHGAHADPARRCGSHPAAGCDLPAAGEDGLMEAIPKLAHGWDVAFGCIITRFPEMMAP